MGSIQKGGLYKIKGSKSVCDIEEKLSSYVRVIDFASNPLKRDCWYVCFIFVYKDTLMPTSLVHPYKILPYDLFGEYFELNLSYKEVNDILRKQL